MKKLFLFLFLIPLSSFSQEKVDKAIAYNDNIVSFQNAIIRGMLDLNDEMASSESTFEGCEKLRLELLETIKNSISEMQQLKSFDGNDELRKTGLDLFRFYQRIMDAEYKEVLEIVFKEEISDDDYTRISELTEKVSSDELAFDDAFQNAQANFAKKYGISLEENELQKEIEEE